MQPPNEVTFEKEVRKAERSAILQARALRRGESPDSADLSDDGATPINAVGLSFSGGGIRSATFNLGVLQALAELGLLKIFDYMSTVSGGGYIGSWFSAWVKRDKIEAVQTQLKVSGATCGSSALSGSPKKPHEIAFLSEYSNYLTPRLGPFSGDTWAFVGSYVRNLILNQMILGLFLISLLLLSRPFLLWFWDIVTRSQYAARCGTFLHWPPFVAAALLIVALGVITANLSGMVQQTAAAKSEQFLTSPRHINCLVIIPIEFAVWILWAWCWGSRSLLLQPEWTLRICLFSAGALVLLWLVGCGSVFALQRAVQLWRRAADPPAAQSAPSTPTSSVPARFPSIKPIALVASVAFWAAVAGAVGGFLLQLLLQSTCNWIYSHPRIAPEWHVISWGFPLAMLIFLFAQTVHIGLVGITFSEDAREWWGRLLGLLARLTLGLSAFHFVCIDGPWLVSKLGPHGGGYSKWILLVIWALITGSGISVAKSPVKLPANLKISPAIAMKIAPPVFIFGLLVMLSALTDVLVPPLLKIVEQLPPVLTSWSTHVFGRWPAYSSDNWPPWPAVEHTIDGRIVICLLLLLSVAFLLSWRVGVNRFSMNALYRNRLVRCYLGATRDPRSRRPQPFIGFDPEDDSVKLKELLPGKGYTGPFLIMNTALNLVSSKNLAWQQRKAASFVFTPLFSGFETDCVEGGRLSAFTSTEKYRRAISLGDAMAISGAAASPNMGFYSSPALSFLLTVFNVRLGQWFGNPRYSDYGTKRGPSVGLAYLLYELLGHTDDTSAHVYISDGGHFENLGIYELVRRRCRFIVASDVGEDQSHKFGDLGNAIEKCRYDFGIDIEININRLRPDKDTGKSDWHCAIGTIHYERVDPNLTSGTLVYLKSSLTGDEPTDVQRYASQFPAFPHQSTADQWFTESQFESYRALGQHIAQSTFGVIGDEKEIARMQVEDFFVRLRQHWYPPNPFNQQSFTKHSATYCDLLKALRTNDRLKFLDRQVFPQWSALIPEEPLLPLPVGQPETPVQPSPQQLQSVMWLPDSAEERREGFYLCNQVIQLFEDAYLDLNLETQFDHPDNRGWLNLFRHWSWSGMFCATWAISASVYGARFQNFCERRLDLHPGKVELGTRIAATWPRDEQERSVLRNNLQISHGMDSWELDLIRKFLEPAHRTPTDPGTVDIIPLRVAVPRLLDTDRRPFSFNIGFALGQFSNTKDLVLWYFRVQNHVRQMGLAREALRRMMENFSGLRFDLPPFATQAPPDTSPSIAEAFPSGAAIEQFRKLFDSVKFGQGPTIGS